MGWVGSALNLVFLFVMLLSFGQDLIYGVPLSIRAMLLMPIVTGVLGVVSLILAVTAWIRGTWPLVGRPYYSLIALASVVFALFAGYWNMVGWRF